MIKCVEKHLCHDKKSLTQSKIDTVNKYKPNCEALKRCNTRDTKQ